ncbi:MAG: pyridoxamine 5'-phosphate oxidase family protein [Bacteroidetes bacterium]|nr:pyridoxamine 5'-phosphate oxidase family protein [Bacteroidota bacterium]
MIAQLSADQTEALLLNNSIGRIGCSNGTTTYIIPVNYAYDGKSIICHSQEGMKIHIMRNNPEVCFEVDEITDTTHWKSVLAHGRYQELQEERERIYAMTLFSEKFIHLKFNTGIMGYAGEQKKHPEMLHSSKPVIYRIIITEKTGRYEFE